jgi:midasin (ATPase involved in ribosome maturation)
MQEGGGRKNLFESFLNRFTKVYIDKFESFDLFFMTKNLSLSTNQREWFEENNLIQRGTLS